jgi:hypothetical protein
MLPSKYDPNNYTKHGAKLIYKKDGFQKLDTLFGSYLLMVKWGVMGNNKLPANPTNPLIGTIRRKMSTPLGDVEPKDYHLHVSTLSKYPVQFLTIDNPDFQYSLEILNPIGIEKTSIEIWEYIPPITYSINMPVHQPIDDSNLIAALAANTNAVATAAIPEELDTQTIVYNTPVQLVSAEDSTCRGVSITTETADRKYRVFVGDGFAVAPQFSDPGYSIELSGVNAMYELSSGEQSNVWVCTSGGAATYSCTRTFVKPSAQA